MQQIYAHNYHLPEQLAAEIFRAYDIRGIVGDSFNENTVFAIGKALAAKAIGLGQDKIFLGYDARPSSPGFRDAMLAGLLSSGIDVIDIGIVPTPVLYYATKIGATTSGVMITGSHNPSNYNGIKMVLAGQTLNTDAITELYARIQAQDFVQGNGALSQLEVLDDYIDDIAQRIKLKRGMKVVVDSGNGVAGLTAAKLYRRLGVEVIELYCDLDGTFPNHHPDPSIVSNLQDLVAAVAEHQADGGLAFDGDADRLGFVTDKGEIIWPDRLLMLLAKDILSTHQGASIIYDVKCSYLLAGVIEAQGGVPLMSQTGHSLVKARMIKEKAPLAGELSGHIFYQDNWYGFDDGVYVGARLLQVLADQAAPASQLFAALPQAVNTPELKVVTREDNKFDLVKQLIAHFHGKPGKHSMIDGLRIDYEDSWFLVRASNTTPCLTVRFEAASKHKLKLIADEVKQALLLLDGTLQIDFESAIAMIPEIVSA